ncbi:3-keto-5-aminohexanoate cleavage protein, partial [Pseudonocardia acidicola]|nr:3-keto-5-aminohexanoate cleavage protein [Pseudonocardia acidicola]
MVRPAGRTEPVIIEVAVNGATPRRANPHVPRSPAEISAEMLDCIERGAAIVHNHNDDPMFTTDGVHAVEPYLQAWGPVLERYPDALLYPTMAAGARGIPVQRRWAHVEELARRRMGGLSLVDPGSVNVGLTSDGVVPENAAAEPYQNSFADVEYMFARSGQLGAAPSISIFEPGFLRTALTLHRHGRVPPGAIVKLYFGGRLEFGLPPTEAALTAYLELLGPSGLPWSVAVLGGDVIESGLAELAIRRGGHVRVGLEDYAGPATPSNTDLLDDALALLDRVVTRIYFPDEDAANATDPLLSEVPADRVPTLVAHQAAP